MNSVRLARRSVRLARARRSVRLARRKLSLVTILSLGLMVLGIGCISWAISSMWVQPSYAVDAASSGESDPSLVLPAPEEILYPECPAEGDSIGSLTIPALERKLPILQGTAEEQLKKGAGHFTQSVLPGEEDNCVLSGHRETVFRQLDDLKIGDLLIVQTSAGTFTYEVNGTRIAHKDDKTVIVPTDHAVLTMTTCYPFGYIGPAPDRYIVSAALVKK